VSLVVNAATAGATNNICINSKRLAGTAVCGPGYSPNQYEVPMEVDVAESPADLSNESAVCVRGQVSCRTRSVPSEVGVRGVSPPAFPRRARVGMAGVVPVLSSAGLQMALVARRKRSGTTRSAPAARRRGCGAAALAEARARRRSGACGRCSSEAARVGEASAGALHAAGAHAKEGEARNL
jgi:hypothetical protein